MPARLSPLRRHIGGSMRRLAALTITALLSLRTAVGSKRDELIVRRLFGGVDAKPAQKEEQYLGLEVFAHHACDWKDDGGQWLDRAHYEKFRFPIWRVAPVHPVPGHSGCYAFGGPLSVFAPLRADFDVFVELTHRNDGRTVPEQCHHYDEATHCGGTFGSCLYCAGARCADSTTTWSPGARPPPVSITRRHSSATAAQCTRANADWLPAGERLTNVSLTFCMPTVADYVRMLSAAGKPLPTDRMVDVGGKVLTLPFMARVYVFDWDSDARRQLAIQRIVQQLVFDNGYITDVEQYRRLPFNRQLYPERFSEPTQYIACHVLFGSLIVPAISADDVAAAING